MTNFFEYTQAWVKGEMFEASLIGLFGLFVLLSGLAFWKFGHTPVAKSLVIPLIVVSTVFIGSGIFVYFSNQSRVTQFENNYKDNPSAFVANKKQRVEGFMYLYNISKGIALFSFIFAVFAFGFTKNTTLQGIAISLLLAGLASLVIDAFSEERANIYYEHIKDASKQTG